MSKAGKITRINPTAAIAGGEIFIECQDFETRSDGDFGVLFGGIPAQIVGASRRRVIAIVPSDVSDGSGGETEIRLRSGADLSDSHKIIVGKKLADDLHMVANPAFDPENQRLIVTRSGSRGQQLPVTLFRLGLNSGLEEISGEIMNPTGLAFNANGQLFVTSRAEGTVYRLDRDDEVIPFASDLGIATGIAFNKRDEMFVGDRSGTIYQVNGIGETKVFATLEQSIAAYHLAFGLNGDLFITRPNVASFDSIMRVDAEGEVTTFYRGLGRPQGLTFDQENNLYVAACLGARRGIVKINSDTKEASIFVAGMNIVGLCFGSNGEMFVATNEAIFSLSLGIDGMLV